MGRIRACGGARLKAKGERRKEKGTRHKAQGERKEEIEIRGQMAEGSGRCPIKYRTGHLSFIASKPSGFPASSLQSPSIDIQHSKLKIHNCFLLVTEP
jgi:hypothetical protein